MNVISSAINTNLAWLGYAADATNISFLDVQPVGKQLSASMDPYGQANAIVTYSATPVSASGTLVRSTQSLNMK